MSPAQVCLAKFRQYPGSTLLSMTLGGSILFAFWQTLALLAHQWANDPRYSHGYLVPMFSLYLLWWGKDRLKPSRCDASWFGLPMVALGLAMLHFSTYRYLDWLGAFGLLPCLAGAAVMIGGWSALRWAWPSVAFLAFMMPLPWRLEIALGHPLQRLATIVSTYALQTMGFVAVAEGNTIRMGEVVLGVVEACSGLSMLVIFFAISTAMAIVIQRPIYERVLIFLAALPVAVFSNIVRITLTGVLHKTVGTKLADMVFHDLAGWLMMPFAMICLWSGLKTFNWVLADVPNPDQFRRAR